MRNPRIVAAIVMLCEGYNRRPTDATFAAYEVGLAGLSEADVERATATALQKLKFMPTPSELRELAGSGGSSFDTMAEHAWRDFSDAVRRLGPDHSVSFADGVTNAVIRTHGGWVRVCEMDGEEFAKWYRKDFLACYVRFCRDGCSEGLRAYHVGLFERANGAWIGKKLPGGEVYRMGMYGTAVEEIAAREYQPALPSPPAQQRIGGGLREQLGLDLKTLGN